MEEENHQSIENSQIGTKLKRSVECPYLDTINRSLLDFDFEHSCSVTLGVGNIYGCLVCKNLEKCLLYRLI